MITLNRPFVRYDGPPVPRVVHVVQPTPGLAPDDPWIGYQRWLADEYERRGDHERAAGVRQVVAWGETGG